MALKFDPRSTQWLGMRLIVLASRYMQPLYAEIERRHALLRDESAVVTCLSITTAVTAQQIVRYTGRPKNSISRAVTALEARGLLSRSAHPDDSRASHLRLTEAGAQLFTDIRADFAAADTRMLGVLSDEEQRQFGHLLSRVSEASVRWT
ncbi:MAG: MarR family transcriptional regulator [Phenylobacterium sp.]|uniref:MarR family winged helix-turn-helix transcriptional regulator n=1 Tax=Phenylobacterium sp. TaxID=1871053 RepID=UPI002733191F|nr:MarR family transcriptional regulator [Phenylobacterium sp.]MDP3172881.1 MarR family transcriptional regulator [Phenylobacterium sp.]